jgi:hypothetical protein
MPVLLATGLPFLVLFGALLLSLELGRRMRLRAIRRTAHEESSRFGIVDGAVFALMGLLLGFSFAAAGGRYETRRQYIVEEANAIGTAWLRLALVPDSARGPLQEQFRQYVDARLAGFAALPDTVAAKVEFARAEALQGSIWAGAIAAASAAPTTVPSILLLPALNQMFDIANTRLAAMHAHMPRVILGLLFFLVLCCCVLAGYGMTDAGPRNWLHSVAFASVLVVTIYVIVDYEFPRWGLINLRALDQPMLEVRQGMGN